MRLPLSPSTEPVAAEPLEMALLSSVLAACSYISVQDPSPGNGAAHRGLQLLTAIKISKTIFHRQTCSRQILFVTLFPENPERAALYFVSGVCIGLFLTLAALVMRISCHTDCRQGPRRRCLQDQESSSDSSDSEDGSEDTASDLSVRRHRRFERTLNKNVFTSAEELERAQRLEERERIIREIWMNGQPEVPGTRSLNRYY
uniref:protein eva-1 homolog A isoform X1 n=1 Tax=Myodes glareolus TaxID=447135 RepID=UPI002020D914|nr:protein eva-1 homolog A isoform X1 [Myodes glareolus]XP_048272336.1 protein eva-1 homolog A isoform X1 [Myodes glareolus]XP_048272337.1 protein eva-1 homolog A isoform X1 [Myodes glareolus]XP_048272338.1 protein eva-1 homolog A isoform X1 [Myodes glareolus]XP_048272339.1 protein eva-1 homolog A isoform X1 [Myodes glareolus]XP_048272340.1 protein eva-1 homolog A isoform X1 [Myodes glareolus]XP_048272341.1 protein eva-1 homolog A isoform X1 [Myodes glareolus]